MNRSDPESAPVFRHRFTVPSNVVDQNGHVNKVAYIQWMQDAATLHFDAVGGTAAMQKAGASWVGRPCKLPCSLGYPVEVTQHTFMVKRILEADTRPSAPTKRNPT